MSSDGTSCEHSQFKWYVQCTDGEIRGPCDLSALKSLFDTSLVNDSSNIWHEGMESWHTISELDELDSFISEVSKQSSTKPDSVHQNIINNTIEGVSSPIDAESASADNKRSDNKDGATSPVEDEERIRKREKKKQYLQRKRMRMESGQWIDTSRNLSVYITGLPDDTTSEEIANVFRRAGVIKIDPLTTLPKIRLYTDDDGKFKNDARVTFVNKESVDFAIRYLDNYHFRENCVIHVEKAKYDPQKRQAKSFTVLSAEEMRKRYLAAKYEQDRLQSWDHDIDDGSGRRIVICKPMFSAEDAWEHEAGDQFYEDLREEVNAEITKFVPVEKVTPIPRHPQGIVCVKLKTSADAEIFISQFQDRLFDGRRLQVYFFDGKTDLQSQCLPSKSEKEAALAAVKSEIKQADDVVCDWIENQSSDEEFEIKTE